MIILCLLLKLRREFWLACGLAQFFFMRQDLELTSVFSSKAESYESYTKLKDLCLKFKHVLHLWVIYVVCIFALIHFIHRPIGFPFHVPDLQKSSQPWPLIALIRGWISHHSMNFPRLFVDFVWVSWLHLSSKVSSWLELLRSSKFSPSLMSAL